jgi:hypothetical protein
LDDNCLVKLFEFGTELLVMPCLGEPAYDADVVSFGRTPAVIARRRHNPTGIPFLGNTVVSNRELLDYCRAVTQVLGLQALHDIDLMTGPDGRPLVLEVNPRPSGSLSASMAACFPLLDWAVDRALGNDPATFSPEDEIVVTPELMQKVQDFSPIRS